MGHGFWFDKDELKKVLLATEPKQGKKLIKLDEPETPEKASGAKKPLQVIVDFLNEFFG